MRRGTLAGGKKRFKVAHRQTITCDTFERYGELDLNYTVVVRSVTGQSKKLIRLPVSRIEKRSEPFWIIIYLVVYERS